MLRVESVSKNFGGIRAVHRCSLEVEKGTITGLIGPNGAGKTTLFNTITGFYVPDEGKIFYKARRIDGMEPFQVFHQGVIRTFQISRELKSMTVLENLMMVPARQLGEKLWAAWIMPRSVYAQERQIEEKANQILESVELGHLRHEYAKNLSGGQKRLLELARTMMAEPEIILLDEPGAGVNPTLMKKLQGYIEQLNKEQGITFFLIEHDMDLVMNLCNPIIVMSNGTKLMQGTADEVKNNKEVVEAYLGGLD